MGDLINLNRYRKQRERLRRSDVAAANRTKFGRTRAERAADRAQDDKAQRELDGKKLEESD